MRLEPVCSRPELLVVNRLALLFLGGAFVVIAITRTAGGGVAFGGAAWVLAIGLAGCLHEFLVRVRRPSEVLRLLANLMFTAFCAYHVAHAVSEGQLLAAALLTGAALGFFVIPGAVVIRR